MRKLNTNARDTFRVKAYAGTSGVLLGCDLDKSLRQNFLGFAIEHKETGKDWQWLLNSLTFPGHEHTLKKWRATPSNLAPIQKFRWADYTIAPNTTRKYRVHPAYGTPDAITLGESLEVTVTTDDGKPKDQRVIFNRAVAASQAFGRNFPDLDALLNANKNLPIEAWPAAPREWLQHGLLDQIIAFIARAKDSKWALDVAIYEYELAAIVDAVNAAHKRGVEVRVIYHAKKGDEQTEQNIHSLKKIPAAKKRGRETSRIFHDKFIVLSKVSAAGKHSPQALLSGSTNFTENGVYRQANVVHVVDNKELATRYATLFQVIWDNPSGIKETKKWIDTNNPIDPTNRFFAGFSPRTGGGDLAEFVNIINSADRDVLFATAFALPESILDALLGAAHDDVLRYGIQNTSSRITGYHADRSAEFAATALLNTGIEGWIKEGLKGQRGRLLVHLKAVVANFTSDAPIIISGSHNLSKPASEGNDENYFIIRGDTDLADRYGLEILRFYEHYRFRYYAQKLKLKEVRPLAPDNSWSDAYYQPGNLKALSRVRFAGR
jgi:phosphatidylserine/phosphatidylglycerophosphate/cardiolipin synthase-like enzyme